MTAPIRLSDEQAIGIVTNGIGEAYSGHLNLTHTMADAWGLEYMRGLLVQKPPSPRAIRPRHRKIKFAGYDPTEPNMRVKLDSWTEDRVAVLTRMWAAGHGPSVIAATLGGTTKNAVAGKAFQLQLPTGQAKTRQLMRATK